MSTVMHSVGHPLAALTSHPLLLPPDRADPGEEVTELAVDSTPTGGEDCSGSPGVTVSQ